MQSFAGREWLQRIPRCRYGRTPWQEPGRSGRSQQLRSSWFVLGLDLRQAAVYSELAGGHEAAVLRRKKGGRRPELRWVGHALERSHRGEGLYAFLAYRFL